MIENKLSRQIEILSMEYEKIRYAVILHLVANGPCDDCDDQEDSICKSTDCTYCEMARIVDDSLEASDVVKKPSDTKA